MQFGARHTTVWRALFQGKLGKVTPFLIFMKQETVRVAVASAGPYANHLHLTADRYPRQHLITQFLQYSSWRPTNSVKALKARPCNYNKTQYNICTTRSPHLVTIRLGNMPSTFGRRVLPCTTEAKDKHFLVFFWKTHSTVYRWTTANTATTLSLQSQTSTCPDCSLWAV